MKTKHFFRLFTVAVLLTVVSSLSAQVTVGSDIVPTKGALLDLKNRQMTSKPSNGADPENYTTGTNGGGLLLPRVKLIGTNTLEPLLTSAEATDSLKRLLTGLMVYNISTIGALPPTMYPAVYTWSGDQWKTSEANTVDILTAASQPKAFSFNEKGIEGDVPALTFSTSGGVGALKYQWYMIVGYNLHARVGDSLVHSNDKANGSQTATYTPKYRTHKGTTRIAANNGFYRFYCVVTDDIGQRLESNIAEVAVGCGAKNNMGEWLSFMCFNLGADNDISINDQITRSLVFYNDSADNRHYYANGEDELYGHLFQWGRIADDHQIRPQNDSPPENTLAIGAMTAATDIGNGMRCGLGGTPYPYQQIKTTSTWYGKFVTNTTAPYNWTVVTGSTADNLWRAIRFRENDPCAHYNHSDGSYTKFWNEEDNISPPNDPACIDPGTGWRIPSQSDWGEIYKGGIFSGSNAVATANTWKWVNAFVNHTSSKANYNKAGGYQIQPDNATTTLFLPAGGLRSNGNGLLYHQGTNGYYWSGTVTGTNAYSLLFLDKYVNPGNSSSRAGGLALRCIKST